MNFRPQLAFLCVMTITTIMGTACSGESQGKNDRNNVDMSVLENGVGASIKVSSPSFANGESIPGQHSCYALDLSPPISWSGLPTGTKSLALIAFEPDAPGGGDWIHWLLYGMPPDTSEVPSGLKSSGANLVGGTHGTNDFKRLGWGGPCPPRGATHFYLFKVYALDSEINLAEGAKQSELVELMKGHVIAHGQLTGSYHQKDGRGDW